MNEWINKERRFCFQFKERDFDLLSRDEWIAKWRSVVVVEWMRGFCYIVYRNWGGDRGFWLGLFVYGEEGVSEWCLWWWYDGMIDDRNECNLRCGMDWMKFCWYIDQMLFLRKLNFMKVWKGRWRLVVFSLFIAVAVVWFCLVLSKRNKFCWQWCWIDIMIET